MATIGEGGAAGTIPDATSGPGGDVKGKATFDEDKGLLVVAGVAEVKLDSLKLLFASGNITFSTTAFDDILVDDVTGDVLTDDITGNVMIEG